MRTHIRSDLNQFEIVQTLRDAGCSVQILSSVGGGCPDLLVARSGEMVLMEAKFEKGKLSPGQVEWHDKWKAAICIVRTPEEALDAIDLAVAKRRMVI